MNIHVHVFSTHLIQNSYKKSTRVEKKCDHWRLRNTGKYKTVYTLETWLMSEEFMLNTLITKEKIINRVQ